MTLEDELKDAPETVGAEPERRASDYLEQV